MTAKLGQVEPIYNGHGLLSSEKRSLLWLEKSPVCTKVLDLDLNLQYMSSAGSKSLNIENVADYYGKPYPFDFYPKLFRENMVKNLRKALKTSEVVTQEGSTIDIVGNELWFQSTIVPVEDDRGNNECLIVISVDITSRKQLERELRKSHALFSQAEQMGKMGHWEWDVATDRLIACSEQYAAIFDLTMGQVMASGFDLPVGQEWDAKKAFEKDVMEFIHEEDRDTYMQVTTLAYERKVAWDVEFRIITGKGRIVHLLELGEPVLDEQGTLVRTFGTLQDISDRKKTEEQLNYQANHDALTGLINRREFEKRAGRLLSSIKWDNTEHAMCFMDLDQFKVVNDTCGHSAGDELLVQLSSVLKNIVRQRDTLARLGGDEFGLLMEHCSLSEAHRVVTTILKTVNEFQFTWEGNVFRISVSIGLTPITETTAGVTELLQDADAACYIAKDKGRNRVHVHHAEDGEIAKRHGEMRWVTRLNQALDNDHFCLYAQAIQPLDGSTSTQYELLLRLVDEERVTPPNAFLPAAERYNLSPRLDCWVINHALETLASSPRFVEQLDCIFINLSGPSLTDATFLEFVVQQLQTSGVSPEKICFEITETAAISNLSRAITFIATLRKLGCRFALDDFGSGLSSFAYLKNLPVDYLKIDGMFVKDIVDDPIDCAMVRSINEIGQLMGKKTIAEFVENDGIKAILEDIGVDFAQGYGIHRPQSFTEMLRQWPNTASS